MFWAAAEEIELLHFLHKHDLIEFSNKPTVWLGYLTFKNNSICKVGFPHCNCCDYLKRFWAEFGCSFAICQIVFEKFSYFLATFSFHFTRSWISRKKTQIESLLQSLHWLSADLFKSKQSINCKVNNIRVVIIWKKLKQNLANDEATIQTNSDFEPQ